MVSGVAGSEACGATRVEWGQAVEKGRVGSLSESVHPGGTVCRERSWPRGPGPVYYTSQEAVRRGRSRDGSAGFGRRRS